MATCIKSFRVTYSFSSWCCFNSRLLVQCTRHLYSVSPKTERRKSPIAAPREVQDTDSLSVLQEKNILNQRLPPIAAKQPLLIRDYSKKSLYFEKENIWTVPNLLCLFRITASPYLGYLVLSKEYMWTFGLLGIAAITDLLDGYIARRFPSQASRIGSVLDPLADKCLISVLAVTLTAVGLIPLPLTALIISRDLGLICGSFYIRYKTIPPPRTWSKFWDVQRSAILVTPSFVSKLNTTLQLLLIGFTAGAPIFHYVDHFLLQTLWYATALTTLSSGLSYIFQMKGFKILQKQPPQQPN